MLKIVKFILIVFLMGLIFMFSSDNATTSSKKSDGLIIKVCEFAFSRDLSEGEKEKYVDSLTFIVRKSAHFSVYFLLGFLMISFFNEFYMGNNKKILLAFILCFLYACSDEIHQLFVPGRSGEIRDVLIDSTGSILGVYFYHFIYLIRRKLYE